MIQNPATEVPTVIVPNRCTLAPYPVFGSELEKVQVPMFQSHGEVARGRTAMEGCNNVVLSPVKLPHHEGTWFSRCSGCGPWEYLMGVEIEGKVGKLLPQHQPRKGNTIDGDDCGRQFISSNL